MSKNPHPHPMAAANLVRVVRTKGLSILRQLRLEVGRGAGAGAGGGRKTNPSCENLTPSCVTNLFESRACKRERESRERPWLAGGAAARRRGQLVHRQRRRPGPVGGAGHLRQGFLCLSLQKTKKTNRNMSQWGSVCWERVRTLVCRQAARAGGRGRGAPRRHPGHQALQRRRYRHRGRRHPGAWRVHFIFCLFDTN